MSLKIGMTCGGGWLANMICRTHNGRRLERLSFWDVRSSATYLSVVPQRLPGQGLSTRVLK